MCTPSYTGRRESLMIVLGEATSRCETQVSTTLDDSAPRLYTATKVRPCGTRICHLHTESASFLRINSDWFRPASGSSGVRLQYPTSLCRDGLVPSSKSDPRSATDTPNSFGSVCLTPKGLSNLGPARPFPEARSCPSLNDPA
ncbi:hypothetical protein Bca4012_010414 [Brassica carinata]